MAIQVTKIGVDKYTIQINEGGELFLNPGLTGSVSINGDVDIAGSLSAGSSTVVEREDLVVFDNTIRLNAGETGNGITAGTSGLIIDRGTNNDARLFFDESKNSIREGASVDGAFVFQDATASVVSDSLFSLYASGMLTNGGDLYLVGTGTGIVTVTGTVDYEKQVYPYTGDDITPNISTPSGLSLPTDDDALVNARLLEDYVSGFYSYNFQDRITADASADTPTYVLAEDTEAGDLENKVSVVVNGSNIATFYATRLEVENLRFNDNIITSNDVNGSIKLQGTGTGQVQVNDFTNLTVQDDTLLSSPDDGIVLYSKAEGDGGTGLYFKNQNDTQDEIISRNKALLYSIIF